MMKFIMLPIQRPRPDARMGAIFAMKDAGKCKTSSTITHFPDWYIPLSDAARAPYVKLVDASSSVFADFMMACKREK